MFVQVSHNTGDPCLNQYLMTAPLNSPEETFDPSTPEAWATFRKLAHRMVEDMVTHLSTIRDRPAWHEMPVSVREALAEPIPRAGIGAEAAYEDFVQNVLPYPKIGRAHV